MHTRNHAAITCTSQSGAVSRYVPYSGVGATKRGSGANCVYVTVDAGFSSSYVTETASPSDKDNPPGGAAHAAGAACQRKLKKVQSRKFKFKIMQI